MCRFINKSSLFLIFTLSALSCSLAADPAELNDLSLAMQEWKRQPCVDWIPGASLPASFQAGFVETTPGYGGLWLRADHTVIYFCADGLGCPQLKGHWRIARDQIIVTYLDNIESQICEQNLSEGAEYCERNCKTYMARGQAHCRKLSSLATGEMLRIQPVQAGIRIHGQLMFQEKAAMARCVHDLGNSWISAETAVDSGI